MQKKLIALAVAGLVSTGAFAQSNVTIYGVIDASLDFTDAGDTAISSGQRVSKVSSNSSRIGFKGTEDLGDGLKAVFQIESAFDVDGTTTAGLAGRNSFVGLTGDSWGQALAGRYDTPYKTSTRSLDLFGDHLADNRNLMGRSRASGVAFDRRAANIIRYDSPNWGGFKLAASYEAGAEAAATSGQTKGSAWSASGIYTITPEWNVIAAYERHKFGSAATGTLALSGTILPGQTEKSWKLGTTYKSGSWRAGVAYEKVSDDFTAVASNGDHKAWTVGGGYTFDNNEIKLAYTKVNEFEGTSDTGAKQWAIGIDHNLSKRTKAYAEYVRLTNDSNGTYGLTGAGANTTGGTAALGAGADPSAWQFGVRHSF